MIKRTLLVVLLWMLAGCGGSPQPVSLPEGALRVEMGALYFQPNKLEVPKGQPVTLAVVNIDNNIHDWTIDRIPVKDKKEQSAGHHAGHGGDAPDLHVSANPRKTGILTFTPLESGTYEYYCTIPGHKEAGMRGTLVVR